MTLLAGIDLGTSSVKVVVIDDRGRILASAGRGYGIDSPGPGAAEQGPRTWWLATRECLREVLAAGGVEAGRIGGVGVCGQMHGLVTLDGQGEPVRPAIIWPDTRSAAQCARLEAASGDVPLHERTGLAAGTGMLGPSLLWLRDNEPASYARTRSVVLPKDYIRLRLTGELATDPTDASGTLLYDTVAGRWSGQLIAAAGLDPALLPPIIASGAAAGTVTAAAAVATGLPPGTPVATGTGDQSAGAIAIGVSRPGVTASVIGTGGQLFTTVATPLIDPGRRVQTFAHAMPGTWMVMGAILAAALSLDWLAGVLGVPSPAGPSRDALLAEAAAVPAGSEGLIFLPYLNGVRTPHLDPAARGAFVGLTAHHGRGHLVRAVLEGVAYAMRDGLAVLEELGIEIGEVICSGGGARIPLWRQIQADVYDRPVSQVLEGEHSAYGAALIAGAGCGRYSSLEEAAARKLPVIASTSPSPAAAVYEDTRAAATALYPALRPVFAQLARGSAATASG